MMKHLRKFPQIRLHIDINIQLRSLNAADEDMRNFIPLKVNQIKQINIIMYFLTARTNIETHRHYLN